MKRSLLDWYYYGGKIPRKIKKSVLGYKMRRGDLRKLLDSVTFGEPIKTMFERPNISPHIFCPHCGETRYVGTGNKTSYPEHWEYFHCLRCRKVVGVIDNSPFYHALQFKEFNYQMP